MTQSDRLLAKVNAKLDYYKIIMVDRALEETGTYVEGKDVGYGLINKATQVVEHTSVMLPGILWQATHFESTLKSLLDEEETPDTTAAEGDVIPFGPH